GVHGPGERPRHDAFHRGREAVPERLDLKTPLFGRLDAAVAPDTILATNSSSYASRHVIGEVTRRTGLRHGIILSETVAARPAAHRRSGGAAVDLAA
ncbi:hypothetical protein IAE22_34045, partial [Bacillus sp. S34]|nr:hypothetical protein [Bacillus sp. S34]